MPLVEGVGHEVVDLAHLQNRFEAGSPLQGDRTLAWDGQRHGVRRAVGRLDVRLQRDRGAGCRVVRAAFGPVLHRHRDDALAVGFECDSAVGQAGLQRDFGVAGWSSASSDRGCGEDHDDQECVEKWSCVHGLNLGLVVAELAVRIYTISSFLSTIR